MCDWANGSLSFTYHGTLQGACAALAANEETRLPWRAPVTATSCTRTATGLQSSLQYSNPTGEAPVAVPASNCQTGTDPDPDPEPEPPPQTASPFDLSPEDAETIGHAIWLVWALAWAFRTLSQVIPWKATDQDDT